MTPSSATADDETITFLQAGSETILGVATRPLDEPRGVGVVVLPGGGVPLTTGRNRFAVKLCRDLAAAGFHAIRLDYHGAGESTGSINRLRLDRPFVDDALAAIDHLRLQGLDRFILFGSCFGARTALAAASATPEMIGVVLVSCPVRDFEMGHQTAVLAAERRSVWAYLRKGLHPTTLRRLTDRETRVAFRRHARAKFRSLVRRHDRSDGAERRTGISARFEADLRHLVASSSPLLLIYGSEEYLYDDFVRASDGRVGDLLGSSDANVTTTVLEGSVHGFTSVVLQDAVRDRTVDWIDRTAAPRGDRPMAVSPEGSA